MEFIFDEKKNQILFEQRGLTFEEAIEIIANDGILLDFKHPNAEQYPHQRIMVIAMENYPHCIPYVFGFHCAPYTLCDRHNYTP
jgi:uncharacterized DUF497 family protein